LSNEIVQSDTIELDPFRIAVNQHSPIRLNARNSTSYITASHMRAEGTARETECAILRGHFRQ